MLGMAIGFLKTVDDLRNRAFEAKLRSFVEGLGDQNPADIEQMASEASTPDEGKIIGETLFLTLDSYTALDKCEILGVLFAAYLKRVISQEDFRRLALAIDGAFIDDLQSFLENPLPPIWLRPRDETFYAHLERVGLTKTHSDILRRNGTVSGQIKPTPLGEAFRSGFWAIRPYEVPPIPEEWRDKFNDKGELVLTAKTSG